MDNRYTSGRYAAENPDWHQTDASWKASQVSRMIEKHGLAPKVVCDIGCGTGGVLASLKDTMPAVERWVGIEPSADAVEIGQTMSVGQSAPKVEYIVSDAAGVDLHADLALMLDVFEHVPDYLGFLDSARKIADRFIFHIPLDLSAYLCTRGAHGRIRDTIGHLHYFDRHTASATLQDCGYTIDDWFYTAPGIARRSLRGTVAAVPRMLAFKAAPDVAVRTLGGYALMVLATS